MWRHQTLTALRMNKEKVFDDFFSASRFKNIVPEASFSHLAAEDLPANARRAIYKALEGQREQTLSEIKKNVPAFLKLEIRMLEAEGVSNTSSLEALRVAVIDALKQTVELNDALLALIKESISAKLESSHVLMGNLHLDAWSPVGDCQEFEHALEKSSDVLLRK